ncbi:hypothetical protein [Streptomyces sp. NPDC088557]|uniref:hypothetical protein n=1 Tax=Streptomyces sp. NPDC088557 TaxID=3365867 RepID=UPI0037FB625B
MTGRSARRFAALLPALLCLLWAVLPLPTAQARCATTTATAVTAAESPHPTGPTAVSPHAPAAPPPTGPGRSLPPATGGPSGPGAVSTPAAQHLVLPEPHLAPTAVVRLPAAVENPVRLPGTPVATADVPADHTLPARGLLAGDPRRERAPPGGTPTPRAPRGPPATRHS